MRASVFYQYEVVAGQIFLWTAKKNYIGHLRFIHSRSEI